MSAVILIVIVLLVLIAVGAWFVAKRKREREALRERFGPEYDRAVTEEGGRRQAEHRLSDVADRRDKAEIRDLEPQERERYSGRWADVQGAFVDDPVGATRDADVLVGDVMRDRGYPLDDVDDRADLVATDHAELAGHYRAAHAVGQRAEDASTEELRQAFVHYRALFVELLAEPSGRHEQDGTVAADRPGTVETDRSDMVETDRSDMVETDRSDMVETDRSGPVGEDRPVERAPQTPPR